MFEFPSCRCFWAPSKLVPQSTHCLQSKKVVSLACWLLVHCIANWMRTHCPNCKFFPSFILVCLSQSWLQVKTNIFVCSLCQTCVSNPLCIVLGGFERERAQRLWKGIGATTWLCPGIWSGAPIDFTHAKTPFDACYSQTKPQDACQKKNKRSRPTKMHGCGSKPIHINLLHLGWLIHIHNPQWFFCGERIDGPFTK